MLCVVIGTPVRGLPRQQAQEYTALYRKWTPPPGYDIKALYFGSDQTVVTLVDVETSAAIYEAGLPWTGWDWKTIPVVEAADMLQIEQKVTGWTQKILGS
jgi:Domain of unknown function (DUF3303)